MDYRISFFLDTRRETNKGFPLKLRVYDSIRKIKKLYNLNRYYSENDFNSITKKKPAKKFLDEAITLDTIKSRAENVAKNISVFNLNDFEKHFFSNHSDNSNIIDYYNKKIENLFENEQVKTAWNYQSSLKSLKSFISEEDAENVKKIHVLDITVDWLNKYEKYMLKSGKELSTIGFYLRPLKAIYNMAIEENSSYKDHYPFGKNKYIIPSTSTVKRALNRDSLEVLFSSVAKTKEQQKAKDFWFLSYVSNGLNINDIAYLKFKNIHWEENKITFYRGKSIRTSKANLKEISFLITPFTAQIIEKYKNEKTSDEDYIFPIIKHNTVIEQKKDIENFVRFVNQHFKRFASENGILMKVSTYWARHSFSTMALNSGANVEFISESLGHSDIKTTKRYLNGFDDENKQDVINKITDFIK